MGRSTHSDRTTAWAAKQQKSFGYMTKKIVPSAESINKDIKDSSHIDEKEIVSEDNTNKEKD